ncbi:hypothetical protein HYT45_03185 [Candidatus Uhrbacteria bacterium]|nr:hypothetical protein [Candidatus Uhrbacteria bacterium]
MKKYIVVFAMVFAGVVFTRGEASAAKLYLAPDKTIASVGDQLIVDIKLDSERVSANAIQAALRYPADILQAVKLDKTGSVITFWVEEPIYSNANGEISFIGGSSSDFNGSVLQVLRATFKVVGSGTAQISFADGAVTAADGSGTNVLSSMVGIQINVPAKASVEAPAPAPAPQPEIVPAPAQITRKAVEAAKAPDKPELVVEFYPDPDKFYNVTSVFTVKWDLPPDVTDVATSLDKRPVFAPTKSEGLFDNKAFGSLQEGIWYLHVRFRNNIGWGQTANYRLAIDKTAPIMQDINIKQGAASDNPTPALEFQARDENSGVANYAIQLEGGEVIETEEAVYTFSPLPPAKYKVRVSVKDNAGNSTEKPAEFEILPIASPTIFSVTKQLFIGEGGLEVVGTALPNLYVVVEVLQKPDVLAASKVVQTGAEGNWSFKVDEPLKKGDYIVRVRAKDERGALSLPVSAEVSVRERPFIVIGGFELSKAWLLFFLLALLGAGAAAGWYLQNLASKQRNRKIIIAERDVVNAFDAVGKSIEAVISKLDGELDEKGVTEIKFLLKRVRTNQDRVKKYIIENIEEINK